MGDLQSKYSELAFTLLRIIAALLFSCHGAQKLFGVLGGTQQLHTARGLTAGIIEFFGGVLIACGLFARIAAFVASGEMAVAYFWVHAPRNFWPIINRGELAIILCFVFLYIASRGPGRYSFDYLLREKFESSRSSSPQHSTLSYSLTVRHSVRENPAER